MRAYSVHYALLNEGIDSLLVDTGDVIKLDVLIEDARFIPRIDAIMARYKMYTLTKSTDFTRTYEAR